MSTTGWILLIVGFIALHFVMHRGHGSHGGGGHGGHGGDSGHGGGCCGGGNTDDTATEEEGTEPGWEEERAHRHG